MCSKAKLSWTTSSGLDHACCSVLPSTAAKLETCHLPLRRNKEMASISAPLQGWVR